MNVSPIGARIEKIASEKGIALNAIAKRLGWTRQDLHLKLRRSRPRIDTLLRIASVLEVEVTDLLPRGSDTTVNDLVLPSQQRKPRARRGSSKPRPKRKPRK